MASQNLIRTSLRDRRTFPTLKKCPLEQALEDNTWEEYYTGFETDVMFRYRHWCLIGEIVAAVTLFRPMLVVRDKVGKEFTVVYQLDNDKRHTLDTRQFVKGHAIAALYPERHDFPDGTQGMRLEEAERTMVFPCSLPELLRINDKLIDRLGPSKAKACCACMAESDSLWYGRCKAAWYCNKDCQKVDWTEKNHKAECNLMTQLKPFLTQDWDNFNGHYEFPHFNVPYPFSSTLCSSDSSSDSSSDWSSASSSLVR